MEKLVTVIIPVYNVEKYIECCARSILRQTYHNLEIIFVNDGSPDSCGSILDSLKKDDSRITVIHKHNEGVSAARNDGLGIANGEYIIFVDGDDWIDERLVEDFVGAIEKLGTEMAISYSYLIDDNLPSTRNIDINKISSPKAIEQLYLGKIDVAVWNKIYKKNFLKDNNIAFRTQYWFAEGMTFNIECFSKCDCVGVCNLERYHYVTNNESAVRKFNLNSWYCGLAAMEYQRTLLNSDDKKVINAWNYHYRQYNASILCDMKDTVLVIRPEDMGRVVSNNYERRIANNNYCVIRDISKGMVNDGKARKLEKWCPRLYGHAGLFSTAADMGKFASMMLSGNLLDSQFVNKIGVNHTGKKNEDGTFSQFHGLLCYSKNPVAKNSEVNHWLSGNAFALGGYTGNQLTIDYRNQLYIFMASNRCNNRITSVSGMDIVYEAGMTLEWPDGKRYICNKGYAFDRDESVINPAIELAMKWRFLEWLLGSESKVIRC